MRCRTVSEPTVSEQHATELNRKDGTGPHARPSPQWLAERRPSREIDRRALRHGNDGERTGQEVKSVVCEPHAEAEWHQAIRVAATLHGQSKPSCPRSASASRPRPGPATRAARHRVRRRTGIQARVPRTRCRVSRTTNARDDGPGPPSRTHSAALRTRREPQAARCQDDAEPADPRPPARIGELEAGRADGQPDVVVRTRLHAVEAKRAVDVADLGWQEEAELTAALQDHLRGFDRAASGDAV